MYKLILPAIAIYLAAGCVPVEAVSDEKIEECNYVFKVANAAHQDYYRGTPLSVVFEAMEELEITEYRDVAIRAYQLPRFEGFPDIIETDRFEFATREQTRCLTGRSFSW